MNEQESCRAFLQHLIERVRGLLSRLVHWPRRELLFAFGLLLFIPFLSVLVDCPLVREGRERSWVDLVSLVLCTRQTWERLAAAWLNFGAALGISALFIQAFYKLNRFRDAYRHLLVSLFGAGRNFLLIREGEIAEYSRNRPVDKIGGPGMLVPDTGSAVALEQAGRFTRILGPPGFFPIERFENVREVVDLRPQQRKRKVQGITKDGIPVEVDLEIEFQIDPGPPQSKPEERPSLWRLFIACSRQAMSRVLPPWCIRRLRAWMEKMKQWSRSFRRLLRKRQKTTPSDKETQLPAPYPFSEDAVRRAVYNKVVDKDRVYHWNDLVVPLATAELHRILRKYVLDKLLEPEDADERVPLPPGQSPRQRIQAKLNRVISPQLHQWLGVRATRVSLGPIKLDSKYAPIVERVSEQRVRSWQADWNRRVAVTQAKGEAEALRLKELARAQAQVEMILAISQGLQRAEAAERPMSVRDVIALRCLEVLEEMSLDPFIRPAIPREFLQSLQKWREALDLGHI
jgi:regulator of protease activity HflC (stomatin/prohibitin superfamily)